MKDLMGMMKAMGDMKAKAEALQKELDETVVEGRSGAGMVVVTLTAKGDMRGITIDPALIKADEKEILEDLIVAAHADARRKLDLEHRPGGGARPDADPRLGLVGLSPGHPRRPGGRPDC